MTCCDHMRQLFPLDHLGSNDPPVMPSFSLFEMSPAEYFLFLKRPMVVMAATTASPTDTITLLPKVIGLPSRTSFLSAQAKPLPLPQTTAILTTPHELVDGIHATPSSSSSSSSSSSLQQQGVAVSEIIATILSEKESIMKKKTVMVAAAAPKITTFVATSRPDSPSTCVSNTAPKNKKMRIMYPLYKHYESDFGPRHSTPGVCLTLSAQTISGITEESPLIIICPAVRYRDCGTILTQGFGFEQRQFFKMGEKITGRVEIWSVLTRRDKGYQTHFAPFVRPLHSKDYFANMKAVPLTREFSDMHTVARWLSTKLEYANSHVLLMADDGMIRHSKAFVHSFELKTQLAF